MHSARAQLAQLAQLAPSSPSSHSTRTQLVPGNQAARYPEPCRAAAISSSAHKSCGLRLRFFAYTIKPTH